MVQCCTCHSYMCLTCIDGFLYYIRHKISLIKQIEKDDVSFKSLVRMSWMVREKSFFKVSTGPCCAFSKSFPVHVHPQTTVKPSRPPPVIPTSHSPKKGSPKKSSPKKSSPKKASLPFDSDEGTDDDDDFMVTSRKDELRMLRQRIARVKSDETSSNSLYDYHKSLTGCTFNGDLQLKRRPKDIVAEVIRKRGRRARKKSRKNPSVIQSHTEHNIFQGALILPMFGIGIQADSSCDHWYVDHMALAISKVDGTPSVGHCVLSKSCSNSAFHFMLENKIARKKVSGNSQSVRFVLASPEDPSKHRTVWVQIIIIPQVLTAKECLKFDKGTNSFPNEYLTELSMLSQDDIREDVDYTVILGDFSMESQPLPYKLLLLRPTSMLSNHKYSTEERSTLADQIHHVLRGYAGKRGYEMKRICGSSGKVTPASDRDIISVLHEHEGAVPRKLYAVIILRGEDRYYLVYRRINPTPDSSIYTYTYYCPPKDGGAFKMPKVCSSTFFPLADLTYNKMMAVMLLEQINLFLKKEGLPSVAGGPLKCELIKIRKAREVFNNKPEESRMHHLIITFNSFNNFSMVGYPSGYHFDHYYNLESEYIENKILFSISSIRNSIGRGGHILGNMYVYALLDWGTEAKAKAAANRAAAASL